MVFSWKLEERRDPFVQNISQQTREEIPSKKEEEEHH
jgi:hypothetical protein